jgi:hypothetical protein
LSKEISYFASLRVIWFTTRPIAADCPRMKNEKEKFVFSKIKGKKESKKEREIKEKR